MISRDFTNIIAQRDSPAADRPTLEGAPTFESGAPDVEVADNFCSRPEIGDGDREKLMDSETGGNPDLKQEPVSTALACDEMPVQ